MHEIGCALDPGVKRRARENQDSIGIEKPGLFSRRPPMIVVADGMGGYEGGAVASRQMVRSLTEAYRKMSPGNSLLQMLQVGVVNAHAAFKRLAQDDSRLMQMGSTVVAVVLKDDKIYLVNVGDSRAYIVNNSGVRQISYDHSFVAEAMRKGEITESEMRTNPRRNVLTMSISVQRETVEIFTGVFDWQKNDRLVLCSDGLWGSVTEAQLQAVVLELPPQKAADKLVQLANTNQGPDNISVVVVLSK